MRRFSVRPALTMKGRTFKGLRGWSGKPLHPPLTDLPVAAYVLAAVFDVISAVAGKGHAFAGELWHAATWVFVGGAVVSVLTALTGLWDWWKSSEPGTQARRTINTDAAIMVTVTVLALADIAWRLSVRDTAAVTPVGIAVLSVVVEAEHLCMSLRGVRAAGARTVTSTLHGLLRTDPRSRQEFLALTGAAT